MTTIGLFTVNCDATGDRTDGCHWWIANADTAARARREARTAGWQVPSDGKGPDYCPSCKTTH